MPSEVMGTPFPLRIVFGIEAAVLPAALAEINDVDVVRIAIVTRTAIRDALTGDPFTLGCLPSVKWHQSSQNRRIPYQHTERVCV